MERTTRPAVEAQRDIERELEFLRFRVRSLARGRFVDEQDDIVSDAWIRLDRALRRDEARNEEALMARIAWRTWVDFCRRRATLCRALGQAVPLEAVELQELEQDSGIDPSALALWRFSIMEWFRANQPNCEEVARHVFDKRGWAEVAESLGERPNSLAKRWQRCREAFVSLARADRGELRLLLDNFEASK